MKAYFITFRSITFAQRGKTILDNAAIPNSMGRTPKWMEERGCGYSLRIPYRYGQTALELLKKWSIPFSKVYQRQEDETLEELAL